MSTDRTAAEPGGDLPPTIALLWGLRESRRRGGGRPGLSLARIVAAAIELADAEGLPAVSMARVAERLGFTTMSLYRYVASKDELLLMMWDAAGGDPPDLPTGDDWRSRLERWSWEDRATLHRHPWMLQLPITGPPMGPRQLAWLDRALQTLESTPLDEGERLNAILLVTVYVLGQTRLAEEVRRGTQAAMDAAPGHELPTFTQMLDGLVDAEGYPALTRTMAAGAFDGSPDDDLDADFRYGLDRILDGIAARIESLGADPS
ncbi:MAG TPA: TetR/AcrR family transcriptional regulator [Actinomycetales bacterium]|nr:TetR/AcrR family transcriptional regulator [Actinomycetales bacterium]